MKNLNKKVGVVLATALFLTPAVTLADIELNDDITSTTMTSTTNNAQIFLKGKIDGYKVSLAWEKYTSKEEVLGYKIVVTAPTGEQKTVSLGAEKTSLENWDAKAGKNIYQLYVMGSNGELAKSNEVVLVMGENGGYDFGDQTQYKKPEQKPMGEFGGMTEEQKTQIEYVKKSLEENIKTLRENITPENIEEIKIKAENLKEEYLTKVKELGLPQYAKMIEERFKIFYENQITKREELKKLTEQKKEEYKKIAEQKKAEWEKIAQKKKEEAQKFAEQKKEEAKKFAEEQKAQWDVKKEEFKQKMQETKETFKAAKQDLKAKYKEAFAKKLESKLETLGAEKIKAVITKIDSVIEKYKANENLTAEQKEKFVAQLVAVKELLQEKLDELENSINLDELLGE